MKIADGITAEKLLKPLKRTISEKVLHVYLGLKKKSPVWEVAFKSENEKLNYVYVFFENGQWWKRILNL